MIFLFSCSNTKRTHVSSSDSVDSVTHRPPFGKGKIYATSPITGEKYVTSPFFEDFNGTINNDIWHILTGSEHGAKLSASRCFTKDGYLHMIFRNDPDEGLQGAAIETRDEFLYGKWEARIKASNVHGVLNSVYTIDWRNTATGDPGTKQEIDIELLNKSFTGKKGELHAAVHAAGKKSYNSNPDFDLNFDPSADFHIFGYNITPEYIEWFVDGVSYHRYTYADEENEIKIDAPYMMKMNHRTGGQWVGGPPQVGSEAVYLIDWIKFTPMNFND